MSTYADGHRPDPAPASDVVNVAWACDLCADPYPVECFTSDPVRMIAIGDDIERVDDLGDTWLACITCADFLTDRDATGLSAHAANRIALPAGDLGVTTMRAIQRTVISSLLPDRTLVTDVRWPHTPIAARALPRVRDRLVALLRGLIGIPGLDDARRRRIADATYGAAMFCVDGEATEEATAAAVTLSGARLTADLVLAAHGMLVWSAEIGGHEAASAVTWTATDNGWTVAFYRTVGAGLDPIGLQHLRERVGWLVPTRVLDIADGDAVDPADGAMSVLAATLLLIAQRVIEPMPEPADRRVVKAYARARRPAPEVRVVLITGRRATAASPSAPGRSDPADPRDDEHVRRWVSGYDRSQPYGPRRSLRKDIHVHPYLRGPAGAPIVASTTVRVLSRPAPVPSGDTGTPDGDEMARSTQPIGGPPA